MKTGRESDFPTRDGESLDVQTRVDGDEIGIGDTGSGDFTGSHVVSQSGEVGERQGESGVTTGDELWDGEKRRRSWWLESVHGIGVNTTCVSL